MEGNQISQVLEVKMDGSNGCSGQPGGDCMKSEPDKCAAEVNAGVKATTIQSMLPPPQKESKELQRRPVAEQSESQVLESRLSKQLNEYKDVQRKLAVHLIENQDLQSRLAVQKNQLKESESRHNVLLNENQELRNKLTLQQSQIQKLESRSTSLQSENQELQRRLTLQQKKKKDLRSKFTAQQNQLLEFESSHAVHQRETQDLQSRLTAQQKETQELQNRLTLQQNEAMDLQSRLKFLRLWLDDVKDGALGPDLDISVKGEENPVLYAHKLVLASKSPAFCKLLEMNNLKNGTSLIEIDNATVPVIWAVINFCYMAEISFSATVTHEAVMEVAHQYGIDLLVRICEKHLVETIDTGNIRKRLNLARRLDAKTLQAGAFEYLKTHYDDAIAAVSDGLFLDMCPR